VFVYVLPAKPEGFVISEFLSVFGEKTYKRQVVMKALEKIKMISLLKLSKKINILFAAIIACILLIIISEGKFIRLQNVLVILLSVMLFLTMLLNYYKRYIPVIKELWFVHVIFALFFDFALISKYTIKNISSSTIFLILVINICLFVYSFILLRTHLKTQEINKKTIFNGKFRYNIIVFIIIFIYLLLRIKFIDTIPSFDAGFYIEALLDGIYNFDFSIRSFINGFALCGHNTSGYAALMAISQFLDPGNIYLLNIENTLINIIAIYSFSKIICYFFDYKKYYYEICLICCIFAFNPLFFGTSLSINIDFPCMVFFTACLSAFLYKEKVLFVFYSTLLVLTKETGVLLYAVFIFFLLLYIFIQGKYSFSSKIKSLVKNIYLYVPGFIFIFYFFQTNGRYWARKEITRNIFTTFIGNKMFSLWLNDFSSMKNLFYMLFLNFTWIEIIFILLFVFKRVFVNGITITKRKNILTSIIMTYFAYFLFFLFFKNWPNPRYVIATVFFNTLFFFFAINGLVINRFIKNIMLVLIFLLNIISIFKTYDPLTLVLFPKFRYGNGYMISGRNDIGTGASKIDAHIYNAQYTYHTKLLNKLFNKIKLKSNDKIIFFDTNHEEINLYSTENLFPSNRIDLNKSTITRRRENSFFPDTYFLDSEEPDYTLLSSLEEAYYVSNPWEDNEAGCIAILNEVFEITDTYKIVIDGYSLRAYKLMKNRS